MSLNSSFLFGYQSISKGNVALHSALREFQMNILRGHSKTTLTRFWPLLTTYLPLVDIFKEIP